MVAVARGGGSIGGLVRREVRLERTDGRLRRPSLSAQLFLSRRTTEAAVAPLCLGRVLRRCQMPLQSLMPMDLATVMG